MPINCLGPRPILVASTLFRVESGFVMQRSNTWRRDRMVNEEFMTDSRARLFGVLGAIAVVALVLATLLPTQWVPRTGLGWENEHFIVYFVTTIILSLASRKPYVVAFALTIFAGVLEACQGLTPDRFPDVTAALSGAVGVVCAATLVIFIIWAKRALPMRNLPSQMAFVFGGR
jgi:VanZ family protein